MAPTTAGTPATTTTEAASTHRKQNAASAPSKESCKLEGERERELRCHLVNLWFYSHGERLRSAKASFLSKGGRGGADGTAASSWGVAPAR